ncbi:MAG: RNA methyltransferase [Acidobacteria bacterium]|nr:RNA methyltransferase [Acidobacteriota bacterium]
MERITSRDNEKIKHALRVRSGKEPGKIFIEGKRLALEALGSGLVISHGFVSNEFLAREDDGATRTALERSRVPIYELPNKLFASIADTESPQGVILIAMRPMTEIEDVFGSQESGGLPLVLMLSRVNNPANLGAILRTAEAAGVRIVITTVGSTDAFSPKALRASMGSSFRLQIIEKADEGLVAGRARELGWALSGTTMDGAVAHTAVDWTRPRLLVFGSEAYGISPEIEAQLDERIAIEMEKPVESLNLAVSAGIILFEARRQVQG